MSVVVLAGVPVPHEGLGVVQIGVGDIRDRGSRSP